MQDTSSSRYVYLTVTALVVGVATWGLAAAHDAPHAVTSTATGPRAGGSETVARPRISSPPTPSEIAELVRQERPRRSRRFYGADPTVPPEGPREFFFTRAVYSGRGFRRGGSWSVDFPKADRQFLWGLRRLTNIDAYEGANALRLTDPELRRFPFLYALEVGYMRLTPEEVDALRSYLLAGGFLIIDDFWGSYEWANFEAQIRRVLPEYPIVELPLSHPLFSTFYEIGEVKRVHGVRYAWYGGTPWERDGYEPHVRAIFDDDERLIVVINWNTDLGDAWEWAEDPFYPLEVSTYAYQIAVNTIIYAMSH